MRRAKRIWQVGIACLLLCPFGTAFCQEATDLKPVSNTYAIVGATIIPSPGKKITDGTIVISQGLIVSMGVGIKVPANAVVIKADSSYIYPGFIDGLSHTGVHKPKDANTSKPEDPGNPTPEEAGITPYRGVRECLRAPQDRFSNDKLFIGFTTAQVVPRGVLLPGYGALVSAAGTGQNEIVLHDRNVMYAEFSWNNGVYPSTIMGVMSKWRELYRQTQLLANYQSVYASNRVGLPRPESDRVLESLLPVVQKNVPVLFKTESALEIHRVLSLQNDLGFRLILGNVKEGWDLTDKLKTSKPGIFLSLELPDEIKPDTTLAAESEKTRLIKRNQEMVLKYVSQAKVLHQQGIRFGFSTLSVKDKDIHKNLIRIVEAGLPEEAALAALTSYPAQVLGVSDRLGTLEPGKIANLIVSDKPYFDKTAKTQYTFVEGVLFEPPTSGRSTGSMPADIDGSWSMSAETPQGKSELKMVFKKEGTIYKGNVSGKQMTEPVEFSTISYKKGKLRCVYTISYEGNKYDITVEGTVEGKAFKGTMNVVNFGSFVIEGKKDPKL